MDITLNFGDNLNLYGILLFCGLGYLNGNLLRDVGLYKIIALIFVIPFCIELLMGINLVFDATIPFLLFAVVGFMGPDKSKYYLSEMYYSLRGLLQKIR